MQRKVNNLGRKEAAGLGSLPLRPPYDEELAAALGAVVGGIPKSSSDNYVADLRAMAAATRVSNESLRSAGRVEVREHAFHSDGHELEVLLLRPASVTRPLPLVYFSHSGGMIAGDTRSGIGVVLDLVVRLGVCALSVDYRLAPEHPYPAALDDVFAGLAWAFDEAGSLLIDTDRVVIAGASAGGGITAALALRLRDGGQLPVRGQMLVCPMLDDRNVSASSYELDGEGVWDRGANLTAWAAVLGELRGAAIPQLAAPARASRLDGLPATYLDVGSVEIFRDETIDYAARLLRAGNATELHVWPGAFHGSDWSVPNAALSVRAKGARIAWLRSLLDLPADISTPEPRAR